MDLAKYYDFYEYGATNVRNRIKNGQTELADLCLTNFGNFLEVNPNVVPTKDEGYLCCQRHLLLSGQWQCYRNCVHWTAADEIFDHSHGMRMKGVKKSYFAASHPYNVSKDKVHFPEDGSEMLKGLEARFYHTQKDWYWAGATSLCLIGTPGNLSALNLEYLGEPLHIVEGTLER